MYVYDFQTQQTDVGVQSHCVVMLHCCQQLEYNLPECMLHNAQFCLIYICNLKF